MPPYTYNREAAVCFGQNLAAIRARLGVSQEELSFLAALHRTQIGMIERGQRLPRIDTVVKLAGGLGVLPGELFDGMAWVPAGMPGGSFVLAAAAATEKP